MRKFMLLIQLLFVCGYSFSQAAPKIDVTKKLDTLETVNFSTGRRFNTIDTTYFVDKKEVSKATYEHYDSLWGNFLNCLPCYLKTYDINHQLVQEAVQYGDCMVGTYITYYLAGGVKIRGQYRQITTEKRKDGTRRTICSEKIGDWHYFLPDGKKDRIEKYADGKLVKTIQL